MRRAAFWRSGKEFIIWQGICFWGAACGRSLFLVVDGWEALGVGAESIPVALNRFGVHLRCGFRQAKMDSMFELEGAKGAEHPVLRQLVGFRVKGTSRGWVFGQAPIPGM